MMLPLTETYHPWVKADPLLRETIARLSDWDVFVATPRQELRADYELLRNRLTWADAQLAGFGLCVEEDLVTQELLGLIADAEIFAVAQTGALALGFGMLMGRIGSVYVALDARGVPPPTWATH
jgi:hypothetical protein